MQNEIRSLSYMVKHRPAALAGRLLIGDENLFGIPGK
jgi:hypothetical protein